MSAISQPHVLPHPSSPTRDRGGPAQPLLMVNNLRKYFPVRGGILNRTAGHIQAVDGVRFSVMQGGTLGIVGESGCGKSTLARLMLHLIPPDEGELIFDGEAVDTWEGIAMQELRRNVQMVFQDSYSSLNPRMPVEDSTAYGPRVHGTKPSAARALARALLQAVGLDPALFGPRYPHELSGGLRQCVMIAMALSCRPSLLLADEPTTALDATVQIQVLLLLRQLQEELGMGVIFVTHDLGVAAEIADTIAMMYAGRIVETGGVQAVLQSPLHPYTAGMLSSTIVGHKRGTRVEAVPGAPPDLRRLPPGCSFAPRCPSTITACTTTFPAEQRFGTGRMACCIRLHKDGIQT